MQHVIKSLTPSEPWASCAPGENIPGKNGHERAKLVDGTFHFFSNAMD